MAVVFAASIMVLVSLGSVQWASAPSPAGHEPSPPTATIDASSTHPPSTSGISPPSVAQASIPTYSNYAGYDGNMVIYPTIYPNVTYLPEAGASGSSLQNPSTLCDGYNCTWPANWASIATAGTTDLSYYQTIGGTNYNFVASFYVAGSGVSQFYTTGCQIQYFSCSADAADEVQSWTPYQEMYVTTTSVPSGFWTNIWASNLGLNMTTGNDQNPNTGGSPGTVAAEVALQLLGAAFPPVGDLLTAYAIAQDVGLFSTSGNYQGSGLTDNFAKVDGSGTTNEWAATDNGNELNSSYSCPPASGPTVYWNYPDPNPCAPTQSQWKLDEGENTFGQSIQTNTESADASSLASAESLFGSVTSSSSITLGVQNNIEDYLPYFGTTFYGSTTVPGASASVTYDIAPAVALRGTVVDYSGSTEAISGATVTLAQICSGVQTADFTTTTGPSGNWTFFANPACTYDYSATASQTLGTATSPTLSFTSSSTYPAGSMYTFASLPLNNYPLTFQNTGAGAPAWSVTLDGPNGGSVTSATTKSNQIVFYVPDGGYGAELSVPAGWWYSPLPPSGVTVSGPTTQDVDIYIGWTVTFTESGLTPGTDWTVNFGVYTSTEEGTTHQFYVIPNGTYSWSVPAVTGYTLSPASGSLTVKGGTASQTVTFTPTSVYTVTFSESGVSSSYSWEAYVGSTGKTASGGSKITFTGIAGSNSWQVEEVIVSETCSGNHWLIKYYEPSPDSGTVTAGTNISIAYTLASKVVSASCSEIVVHGLSNSGVEMTPLAVRRSATSVEH